ncbi:MAG TPA: pilus assembly protein, partial [Vitreimonas sp.]|nr:pilus assembly protein [Vitreimonas sp.]
MDPSLLIAVLAFVAIGGAGFAFSAGGQPATANKRVKALTGSAKSDRRKQDVDIAALKRKQTTQEALRELSANEKKSRQRRLSVRGLIAQAGIDITPTVFWIMSGVAGAVL